MISPPADEPAHDWLDDAWLALPDRYVDVLARRLNGEKYAIIGEVMGLSRQRVNQLQQKAETALLEAQRRHAPDLPQQLAAALGDNPAVPDDRLAPLLATRAVNAREVLFRRLGIARPRTWSGDLIGYWTCRPAALDSRLRQLVRLAPMSNTEAQTAAKEFGLSELFPVRTLLEQPESRLVHHSLGWIRAARTGRDLAYLWLRDQGEPRAIADIAQVTGTSEHAIRETLRRDGDFAQVRPEGTWALADWRLPGADNRYSSAVDVVVEVLRELGPLDYEQLKSESQQRYPVSSWRITQCLSSHLIGLNADGLYDLAEHGAVPIEDSEPKRPATIQVHGEAVGIEITVDSDLLRGSGIGVSRWLTWYLGLRTAPTIRYFTLTDFPGEVSVKRATSSSQLSSLRSAAQSMDLVEGCKMALILNLNTETASIRHICLTESCPAR